MWAYFKRSLFYYISANFFKFEITSHSTRDIFFSPLISKNSVDAPAYGPSLSFFCFPSSFSPSLSSFVAKTVLSRCQDVARMFFVSEMFLVKASRPTRCHLLSLSCLSLYLWLLRALSRPPFSLCLARLFSFSRILSTISSSDILDGFAAPLVARSAIEPRLRRPAETAQIPSIEPR